MANNTIQALYEMAKSDTQIDPLTGAPKMDEAKLRRALEQNAKLGRRNADVFREGESKFYTCPRYNPCAICDKCKNKASHLYVACQTCHIPICAHSYKDISMMIKRKNFTQYVTQDVMDAIKQLDEEVCGDKVKD